MRALLGCRAERLIERPVEIAENGLNGALVEYSESIDWPRVITIC